MIDINELREIGATMDELNELLDRLEVAESECLEQARLNGMGGEREAALLSKLEAAVGDRDKYKAAYIEWLSKTEWIQEGLNNGAISPKYLGWHRADVAADLLKSAEKEREELRADKKALEREAVRLVEQADSVAADLVSAWKERDALRGEIERMKKQEPVATTAATHKPGEVGYCAFHKETPFGSTLYALPGAQPAPDGSAASTSGLVQTG